jgi:predicted transcriptional regulator
MQRTIELDDEQIRVLERLAATDCRSLDEVVQQAVDSYLVQRRRDWSEWGDRFDALVERVRAHVPADVTPEQIESDITAARAEVRAERAARRGAASRPDASRR